MKILSLLSVLLAAGIPLQNTYAEVQNRHKETTVEKWGIIDTQGLEGLLNAKVPFSLVDARTDKYFDGTLIAGARRLPADATPEVIGKILPNKHQLVVVYCAGEGCPASKILAQRLVEEGYKNVIDYHDGIRAWVDQHKPTQKI